MPDPYTSCAKELLRGKRHVADCCDPETAEALATLLNHAQFVIAPGVGVEQVDSMARALWPDDMDEASKFTVEAV